MTNRISFVLGTRPEAIKLCPLILAVQDHPRLEPHVCVTGQHREMLPQALDAFGVVPDVDLALMRPNQSLADLTARTVTAVDHYLAGAGPDVVVVQGDTTASFCAALAASYRRIPVAHVEAGLRTWNKHSPFPEETNRVLTTHLADYHFAPTQQARSNLLAENVAGERIFVTGNTVIDALFLAVARIREYPPEIPGLPPDFLNGRGRRSVLVTGHRRESFGKGHESICRAILELARRLPDVDFVYPVHLNPNVREPVYRLLANKPNVHLIEPQGYLQFVALMDRATIILTDSGGVQEEAPSLGKPVLVMRDTTERPEGVAAGVARLAGTSVRAIVDEATVLLTDADAYHASAATVNPYGDGRASGRIVAVLEKAFAEDRKAA
ncbi:MAG: UDP-N-acetylglucosamine 2-epimerase (non-hydrolyzing) [Candidatus Nealsonbacteria bacterium]|nr:UDP-N-acetylglucosamine 2-epimerase (non-hydrolyzing) [Candidatus Nealsonbacteria bacterium]